MAAKRAALWLVGLLAFSMAIYVALLVGAFSTVRDGAYFEQHPDELRRVLNECRSGGGFWPECENAEAVATY